MSECTLGCKCPFEEHDFLLDFADSEHPVDLVVGSCVFERDDEGNPIEKVWWVRASVRFMNDMTCNINTDCKYIGDLTIVDQNGDEIHSEELTTDLIVCNETDGPPEVLADDYVPEDPDDEFDQSSEYKEVVYERVLTSRDEITQASMTINFSDGYTFEALEALEANPDEEPWGAVEFGSCETPLPTPVETLDLSEGGCDVCEETFISNLYTSTEDPGNCFPCSYRGVVSDFGGDVRLPLYDDRSNCPQFEGGDTISTFDFTLEGPFCGYVSTWMNDELMESRIYALEDGESIPYNREYKNIAESNRTQDMFRISLDPLPDVVTPTPV